MVSTAKRPRALGNTHESAVDDAALGATRVRVVVAIFRRPLSHVGLGILAGAALIFAAGTMAQTTEFPGADRLGRGLSLAQIAMLLAYATLMLGVCLLACVVPTRGALGVEPTIALRVDQPASE